MTLLLYIVINLFSYILKCFILFFVWCPCMAINVSVQHNGGFLPCIILTVDPMLLYFLGAVPFRKKKKKFLTRAGAHFGGAPVERLAAL